MTKITLSKKMKVFTIICAVILTAGFGWGFLYFLLFHPFLDAIDGIIVTWGLMFPLFLFFSTLSVFGVLEALFFYCSFDDEQGIEYYSGAFKVKKIPVSALESFLMHQNGVTIKYITQIKGIEKVKKINISNTVKDLNLLVEWLDAHTKNLNAEQIIESIDEFKDAHSELSDDEKGKLFEKLHRVAKILKWVGIGIAVLFIGSIFLGLEYFKIGLIVCGLYPVVLIILLRFFKGGIRLNEKTNDIYPSFMGPFMFCMVALLMASIAFLGDIYSYAKQCFVSIIITAVMYVLYYFCASDSEKNIAKKRSSKIGNVISILVLLFFYGFGFSVPVNILFDKSKPTVSEVTVVDQHISSGKSKNYYLKVSPWIDGKKSEKEISVGSKLYSSVHPGDKIKIKLHKGFLGVPWFNASSKL